jgi:hypothetical protein
MPKRCPTSLKSRMTLNQRGSMLVSIGAGAGGRERPAQPDKWAIAPCHQGANCSARRRTRK